MKTNEKRKVGRPVTKKDRVKIGLSIDGDSNTLLSKLAESSGKTKSKVFEEAIKYFEGRTEIIKERLQIIEDLGDDAFLDITEYIENRKNNQIAKDS